MQVLALLVTFHFSLDQTLLSLFFNSWKSEYHAKFENVSYENRIFLFQMKIRITYTEIQVENHPLQDYIRVVILLRQGLIFQAFHSLW